MTNFQEPLQSIQYKFITDVDTDLSQLIRTNIIYFEYNETIKHQRINIEADPDNTETYTFLDNLIVGKLISATVDTAVISITFAEPSYCHENRQFNTLLNLTTMAGPAFYMFHAHFDDTLQKNVWISDDIPLNAPPIWFTDVPNQENNSKNDTRTLCLGHEIYNSTYINADTAYEYVFYQNLKDNSFNLYNDQFAPFPGTIVTQEIMKYILKKNLLNVYGFANYKPPFLYIQSQPFQGDYQYGHRSQICTYVGCNFITPSRHLAENNTTNNLNNLNTKSVKAIITPDIQNVTEVVINRISFMGPSFVQYTYTYNPTKNLFERVKTSSSSADEIFY